MSRSSMVAISVTVIASSGGCAQGKVRTEVSHDLIDAQQTGLNYGTKTSPPDVNRYRRTSCPHDAAACRPTRRSQQRHKR
ncbi:hypothetical protein B0G77_5401 [Paraburkholderia sp. BL10I2N1]|nr:hypothetical protein B0G77_5401 [Paraburkholderia sp. BL10I2N1]